MSTSTRAWIGVHFANLDISGRYDFTFVCALDAGVSAFSSVEDCKSRCEVVLILLHQWMNIIVIIRNNVRGITTTIATSIVFGIVTPVVAQIVCVCVALVGVDLF